MRTSTGWTRWFLLVGALAGGACTCAGPPGTRTEGGAPKNAAPVHPPVVLGPLPVAPVVQLPPPQPGAQSSALTVVVARPTGAVYGEVRPTITFSKPVMALGTVENEQRQTPIATMTPALPGEWRWLGSASVEFVPQGLVPYSTTFQVTVQAGLAALDGTKLSQPYSFSFSTASPVIQSVDPAEGFRWVKPDAVFTVVMNQAVKDLAQHTRLLVGGKDIALTVASEVNIEDEERAKEKGRRYSRESDEQKGFRNRQTRYVLKPAEPLTLHSDLVLRFSGDLAGTEGPGTLGKERSYRFQTYGPFVLSEVRACSSGNCPYGPILVRTSNRVDIDSLKALVKITPPVPIDWDRVEAALGGWGFSSEDAKRWGGSPYFSLPGKFQPGTDYAIALSAGVKDEFGQSAVALSGNVSTDDLEPFVEVGTDTALIESAGDGALPLHTVNVSTVSARLQALTPPDMARLMARNVAPPRTITPYSRTVSSTRNLPRWSPLPIRDQLFPGAKGGLFLAQITSPELKNAPKDGYQVRGQITDLAVHAKVGAKSGEVWVTRLSNGLPVANAEVELFDDNGLSKWAGKTDVDGLVSLPGTEDLLPSKKRNRWESSPPFALISATADGDTGVTLSEWEGGVSPGAFGLSSAWDGKTAIALGTLFTDRGIYRPGDDVYLKGLVRYRRMGEIVTPPEGLPLTVKITDSKGDDIVTQQVKTSRFGTYDSKLTIDKDAPLGGYSISVTGKAGSDPLEFNGDFRVEEYRAPQFMVDVTTPSADVIAGEPLKATVVSRYLFGGAMAGAKVHWTAARSSTGFDPPNNAGFEFGAETWWWDDNTPQPTTDIPSGGDGEADAQGNVVADLGVADAPGSKTYTYTVEAEATDVNRQQVANRVSITVHPAAVYAGVHVAGDGFATAGKPQTLEVVAVDPKGVRQPGQAVKVVVKRRDWKSIRKKGVGGQYFTESEPVETPAGGCDLKTETTAVSCSVSPDQPGLYLIEATVTDDQKRSQVTRSSFYAVGSGWVSWQRSDTDRIDLVPDKATYNVGDVAKVLVKSPYPTAEAVLTTEREGIFSARHVQLTGAATVLEVPIDETLVPNVFVGLVLSRGRVAAAQGIESGADAGRPTTRFGYVELKVEKKSKRLAVTVKPSSTDAKPREHIAVDIAVVDAKGAAASAEVTVWAVDEGVLRLTDYHAPDPVEALHPERGLSVRIGEPLIHLVERQLYGNKGQTAGGGGGDDSSGMGIRNKFKTTVLFAPSVTTDASGIAHTAIDLPDNLTTYRLMAFAVTDADRVGTGEAKVVVSKKLMALPALPRAARVGDSFSAGVVLHTHGAEVAEATVTAEAQGLKLDGPNPQTVSTADGLAHEVRFRFTAETPGTATLRFKVTGGGESDAVEEKIPVTLPVAKEAVATYGDTTDKRVEGIVPPGGVRPDVGGLDLTLSSTILGGFNENMRQLIEYPYGCVEQMSSRLVPFIALREIYGKFGVAYQGPTDAARDEARQAADFMSYWIDKDSLSIYDTNDPDEVVKRTLAAIVKLQNRDGGFRYWPSLGCSSDWASSYAVLALSRAKEVGYPVDDEVLKQGQAYLQKVGGGTCTPCTYGCAPPDYTTRTFAAYVLARTGASRPSLYDELFQNRTHLPLFARAMLADALYVGHGDTSQAQQVLTELLNHAKESPREVHFEESDPLTYANVWSSDTRTTALVLETLTDISPEHPFVSKIGNYLTKVRLGNGQYRNTQEAAFSLMALTEVVRTKEKETPDFKATVTLGSKSIADATFKGRQMAVVAKHLAIDQLAGLGAKADLTFSKTGPGVLYYGALLRYAPAELPVTSLDRGLVVQRWFEPYAGGGQSTTFYAGDLVRVRVRVATNQERHYVAVDVPLPSGLEPVDTSLASTGKLPDSNEDEGPGASYQDEAAQDESDGQAEGSDDGDAWTRNSWAYSFWSPFNHVEQRDDRVTLFADILPAGVHVSSFVARATTPGEFIMSPAHAEEMYTPEVFGRSEGGKFTVVNASSVASK